MCNGRRPLWDYAEVRETNSYIFSKKRNKKNRYATVSMLDQLGFFQDLMVAGG
jgi:hypothetical protein